MKTIAVILALALAGIAPQVLAQSDFPSKRIEVLVGNAAGGSTDTLANLQVQSASLSRTG